MSWHIWEIQTVSSLMWQKVLQPVVSHAELQTVVLPLSGLSQDWKQHGDDTKKALELYAQNSSVTLIPNSAKWLRVSVDH